MTNSETSALDGTLANLRSAENGIAEMIRTLVDARDRRSRASLEEREAAARHLAACTLQVRLDAAVLAHEFAALATPAGAAAA